MNIAHAGFQTDHGSHRRILLVLLAFLAFVGCVGIELTAQASADDACSARDVEDALDSAATDAPRWQPSTNVPPEGELSAAEAEDLEDDATLDPVVVCVGVALAPVARFAGQAPPISSAAWVPQHSLSAARARGPPREAGTALVSLA